VSFADPDDAVRERVQDLGLSPAARGVDETVRASKVADSNVADSVEQQVRGLLEEEDSAFDRPAESTPDEDGDDASGTACRTAASGAPGSGNGGGDSSRTAGDDDGTNGDAGNDGQVTMEDYL
jgi:hypothetical protein